MSTSSRWFPGHLILLAFVGLPLLMGGACEKKPKADTGALPSSDPHDNNAGVQPMTTNDPVDMTPIPNVDVSKLDGDRQKLFYKLASTLSSPCGKAESLRKSFISDTSCRRAPFAIRYVIMLLGDDAPEDDAIKAYTAKYKPDPSAPALKFDVSKAPHSGPEDAPVRFVEFFDYGCPHCQKFNPIMHQVVKDEAGKVVLYYMMFPLEQHHPDSRSAAQAALAAWQQHKFDDMHDLLFSKATGGANPDHNHAAVSGYAKDLGLDTAKFEKDYDAANAQVTSDLKQGETAGVDSTPTVYFNDRKYEGPLMAKYIEAWIEEELAVNR